MERLMGTSLIALAAIMFAFSAGLLTGYEKGKLIGRAESDLEWAASLSSKDGVGIDECYSPSGYSTKLVCTFGGETKLKVGF